MRESNTDLPVYLFHQGTNYHAYKLLGVHKKGRRYLFRVWAPNAQAVFVCGDFNGWSDSLPMTRLSDGGIWEAALSDRIFGEGQLYKFLLRTAKGDLYKSDPYATASELVPGTASVSCTKLAYPWHDRVWMSTRKRGSFYQKPINIYELHIGSWKKKEDGSVYNYRELAAEMIPYIKTMGYTHIELMPVMEHPFDGSWGYQICGYYAPSSRYGTPLDFKAMIDALHGAGIGVILDWVPAHFPKDAHGLYEFDGQPLYECQGTDRMEHAGWGTRKFDLGRNEVECFLISNAVWWVKEYHADGLRVDAVASMIYLDYDKKPGQWIPNTYGDNRCLEGQAFLKKLNTYMKKEYPDVLMIAEESGSSVKITGFEQDGLGFDMKWDMGWMNDTLTYAALDPLFRKYHHDKLTFSMMYAFSERYVLPVSHDEVVHGKKSFLDKMPGDYREKFAGSRVFGAYMMTHPGKKLTFMGSEIGQFREWDYKGQVEWFLLDYEQHAKLQRYYADLNRFYLTHPALWEIDDSWEGFQWIDPDDRDDSLITFRRIAKAGSELIVALNFTPVRRDDFHINVPAAGIYHEVFNSDREEYGGWGQGNPLPIRVEEASVSDNAADSGIGGMDNTRFLSVTIPSLGAVIFEREAHQTESTQKQA